MKKRGDFADFGMPFQQNTLPRMLSSYGGLQKFRPLSFGRKICNHVRAV
jgi:hypothetical protein